MTSQSPKIGVETGEGSGTAGVVSAAHNAMADEYDHLDDLWYPWLFARIHDFIASNLPPTPIDGTALDAGCGTGLQTFLLARAGYSTQGIDIADRLLEVAISKVDLQALPPLVAPALFEGPPTAWLSRYHAELARRLERVRSGRRVQRPTFALKDLTIDELGSSFDVVSCCGSTLSFVDDYVSALRKLAACLRPGGLLFLEAEQKVNLDLIWPLADRASGGRLGYGQSWKEALATIASPLSRSERISYPFELHNGPTLRLPIWLFSVRDLESAFSSAGLDIVATLGIHSVTNVLPSTLLHKPGLGPPFTLAFSALRWLEERIGSVWPAWRLGCSVTYCLRRT